MGFLVNASHVSMKTSCNLLTDVWRGERVWEEIHLGERIGKRVGSREEQ